MNFTARILKLLVHFPGNGPFAAGTLVEDAAVALIL